VFKISEVFEKQCRVVNEKPDGSEYTTYATKFETRDSLINKDYIVAIHPHDFRSKAKEQDIMESFPEGTKFSTFILDGNSFRKSEILVVGSFEKFCRMLQD
tara:strand:- start:4363 stop:4665 length:303 start_codon:yes stop_codon:yes gene_type:complete